MSYSFWDKFPALSKRARNIRWQSFLRDDESIWLQDLPESRIGALEA